MEPTQRHPECPDVHLGVCAKCRRLYARDDRLGEQPRDEQPVAGVGGRPDKLSKAEAGETPAALTSTLPVDPLKEQSDALIRECMKEAMTPAEKNRERVRRWRKKVLSDPEKAELLREADRLRKRRKRG